MFNNGLAIKMAGGGLATIGAAGGGYYAYEKGLFDGLFSSDKDFVIVETTAVAANNADVELLKNNYKCVLKITSEISDDSCEIKKISNNDKALAIALKNIVAPEVNKETLKAGKITTK